ncbi:alpha/beta fold hydrolase [Formicincola oecophyllae]|uniref:Alpha/beta fold hydrolase n=1 Tax=Formicincola oecophyllae TaxID=2558361 RepID=A0A4Y6U7S5_9PROT|nr:alpha/beta hydrolase [Formicincola oecophyllae]QDH13469.1 alpha/beta fold hydrolase [Formicincola oecophyllae]
MADQQTTLTLFFHQGWSYTPLFWQRTFQCLPPALPDGRKLLLIPYVAALAQKRAARNPCVAIGHSAGLMDLLSKPSPVFSQSCLGLVAINSFARFVEGGDFPQGFKQRVLQRMAKALQRDPAITVRDFRASVQDPTSPAVPHPSQSELAHGLTMLLEEDRRPALAPWVQARRLAVLTGAQDPLPPAHSLAGLGTPEERFEDGGHLLPLTHPQLCARFIVQAIMNWRDQAS